jgi:large subunit ribosomal protein L6
MSRVGKHAVVVPAGVTVDVKGQAIAVKGKLGQLSLDVPTELTITLDGANLSVTPKQPTQRSRTLWGTTRNNLNNMVKGVSDGYKKILEIDGVGFRAAVQGKELVLQIGFSHEVKYLIPDGITIKAEKPTLVSVSGFDRQKVGQVAAEIRGLKKPEPYKGKGIKYEREKILRKEGKKK